MSKLTGSYYTPLSVAKFAVQRILAFRTAYECADVLEPSVGGGVFLKALSDSILSESNLSVDIVDIDEVAINRVQSEMRHLDWSITPHNIDFLLFEVETRKKYDLIIGNPPFVSKRLLTDQQREVCGVLLEKNGFSLQSNHNLWGAFLAASFSMLKADGALAMVLPAELLTVNYASEFRLFLEQHFDRAEIYSSATKIFEHTDQAAVLIIAHKRCTNKGVFFAKLDAVAEDGQAVVLRKKGGVTLGKDWSYSKLNDSDVNFLFDIVSRLEPMSQYVNSTPGVVTAANKFFIVSKDIVEKFRLADYAKPIIQKGAYVNGGASIEQSDFEALEKSGKPCYLLDFNNSDHELFSSEVRDYICEGEKLSIHLRYKCLGRKVWYEIPNTSQGEAYFFKRCHYYPKLILNSASVLATDSAYRVSAKKDVSIQDVVYSFYNSLTLIMAELSGRTYGRGVLELTPKEFRSLPIPMVSASSNQYSQFAEDFHWKEDLATFLSRHDQSVLGQGLGLSHCEQKRIQKIRRLLVDDRIILINPPS